MKNNPKVSSLKYRKMFMWALSIITGEPCIENREEALLKKLQAYLNKKLTK